MAKKYLSLEEAARLLDMTTEQLMKVREKGDIRGFADRGSWKFREQDVDEFQRSRQADSSPDFPIITGDSSSSVLEEPGGADLSSSDSDVRLFFDETLFDDKDALDLTTTGSDVRLSGDSGPNLEEAGSDDELDLSGWGSDAKISDSDSDVKLVGAGTEPEVDLNATIQMNTDSDSDVVMVSDTEGELNLFADSELKISDSDSDVRLSGDDDSDSDVLLAGEVGSDDEDQAATSVLDGIDSDSDVKLMGSADLLAPDDDSDSDVKLSTNLDRTDSDIRLAEPSPPPTTKPKRPQLPPDDSDLKLINKGSGVRKDSPDSGISLNVRGSGIGLDADESGISLEMDSGISLEADDSGISLESYDSGISLEGFESGVSLSDAGGSSMDSGDSGISLDSGDSGISLDLDDDSGITMDPDDTGKTMPMQSMPGAKAAMSDSSSMTTQFEIPQANDGNDSEFELAGLDDDDDDVGTSTGVLKFDDELEEDLDSSHTVAVPALSGAEVKDDTGEEEFGDVDGAYAADEYGDDEYSDDVYGDDEDLDVHDPEDIDDVDPGFGPGIGGAPIVGRTVRSDIDWGIGTKVMIGISAFVSVLCAVVGIELVRTMWLWTQPTGETHVSSVLQMIGGAF